MPLEIHIQAFDIANLEARMQAMARPAYSAVVAHARGGKPAILFVPTRKHARLTALDLLTYAAADGQPTRFLQARSRAFAVLAEGASQGLCVRPDYNYIAVRVPPKVLLQANAG